MGFKVFIFGKGGCGKSTIVSLLARALAGMDHRVLVVDNDESNVTLYRMLGIEPPPKTLLEYFGGRKKVADSLFRGAGSIELDLLAGKGIDGLPEEVLSREDRLYLTIVGKVSGFGEGCACPSNALAREFLKRLRLDEGDFVLVDSDAGLEHFGRGVEEACDLLLMVVDPTYESVILAERAREMALQADKPLYYALNKVSDDILEVLLSSVPREALLSTVEYNSELAKRSLLGEKLDRIPDGIHELARTLIGIAGKDPS